MKLFTFVFAGDSRLVFVWQLCQLVRLRLIVRRELAAGTRPIRAVSKSRKHLSLVATKQKEETQSFACGTDQASICSGQNHASSGDHNSTEPRRHPRFKFRRSTQSRADMTTNIKSAAKRLERDEYVSFTRIPTLSPRIVDASLSQCQCSFLTEQKGCVLTGILGHIHSYWL